MSRLIDLGNEKYAIIDDKDYDMVSKFSWRISNVGYAVAGKGSSFSMHRLINDTPKGMQTDHINRNRLDNRRKNLRSCTHTENMRNRGFWSKSKQLSGISGVTWHEGTKKWQARVQMNGVRYHLGLFPNKKQAALAVAEIKGI